MSCGDKHTLACDEYGICYSWGSARYGRLGLGGALLRTHLCAACEDAWAFADVSLFCDHEPLTNKKFPGGVWQATLSTFRWSQLISTATTIHTRGTSSHLKRSWGSALLPFPRQVVSSPGSRVQYSLIGTAPRAASGRSEMADLLHRFLRVPTIRLRSTGRTTSLP